MKPRHSLRRILPAAALAPVVLTLALATPALALTTQWNKGLADLNPVDGTNDTGTWLWNAAANWSAGVPANGTGDVIHFPSLTSPLAIDTQGATLNLGNTAMTSVYNGPKIAIYDSTYLAPVYNATPVPNTILPNVTSFTPVAPFASLAEAANAAPALTLASVTSQAGTQTAIFHPLNVTGNLTFASENYTWACYGDVTVGGTINLGGTYTFHGALSAPGVMNLNPLYTPANINIKGVTTLGTVNQINAASGSFTAEATSSGTITNLNISYGTFTDSSPSLVISNLALSGVGTFVANNAAVMTNLPSSLAVGSGGSLKLAVAQNALPAMTTVNGYGALVGDMTGAVYSGGGKNVTLNENAVFGGTVAVPTRADVGGAKLYMAIANGSTGGPYVVGDDGSTSIYKGFAFGNAWTTSATFNKQLTAVGGDLAGYISYVGLNNDTGNIWMGDGTSHTANVKFSPTGYLNLKQSFNVGQSGADLITTFNLSRDAGGAETANILAFSATTGKILAGQTVNVDKGSIGTTQNLRNGGLLGTLTLSNGVFAQPTNPFTALDTGKLHFGDRAVVALTNTANLGYLEALGTDDVTCSDRPIALLPGLNGQIVNLNLGTNQVLAKVLGSCDYVWSSYQTATMSSDLPVGHARFVYNCWDRTDGGRFVNPSVGTEKITYAGNAPAEETPWIGFAATAQQLTIGMEVDAPAAIVQCGTDDPTRLVRPGAFTGVTANSTLIFGKTVTAAGVRILSGTAQFNQNLSSPGVQLGAGTQLIMAAGKTATVTGTLSGTGNWTGGNGVTVAGSATVAPGNSIGTLNNGGGTLTMADGATYACEIGGAGGGTPVAGTDNDLIKGTTVTFAGGWNLHLVNNGLTPGALSGTEVFKLVDATSIVNFTDPTLTGSGFDFSGVSFSISNGDVLMTGLLVAGAASPYDTWAAGYAPADLSNKAGDNDSDTLTNLQEFAFGTNPTVSTGEIVYVSGGSVTPGAPKVVAESGSYSIVFGRRADYVAAGLTYTVQFSAGLDTWVDNNDGTNPPVQVATDGTINAMRVPFVDFISTPSGMQKPTFARVKVEMAP